MRQVRERGKGGKRGGRTNIFFTTQTPSLHKNERREGKKRKNSGVEGRGGGRGEELDQKFSVFVTQVHAAATLSCHSRGDIREGKL